MHRNGSRATRIESNPETPTNLSNPRRPESGPQGALYNIYNWYQVRQGRDTRSDHDGHSTELPGYTSDPGRSTVSLQPSTPLPGYTSALGHGADGSIFPFQSSTPLPGYTSVGDPLEQQGPRGRPSTGTGIHQVLSHPRLPSELPSNYTSNPRGRNDRTRGRQRPGPGEASTGSGPDDYYYRGNDLVLTTRPHGSRVIRAIRDLPPEIGETADGNAWPQGIQTREVKRNLWQYIVNGAKWYPRGGDRIGRAQKRARQFAEAQTLTRQELERMGTDLPPYLHRHILEDAIALNQQFQSTYDSATETWKEDATKNKAFNGEAQARHDQRERNSSRLAPLTREARAIFRDVRTLQQLYKFRERQRSSGNWTNAREVDFNSTIERYCFFLNANSTDDKKEHKRIFDDRCYQILKQRLDTPDLQVRSLQPLPFTTDRQRHRFNEHKNRIRTQIESIEQAGYFNPEQLSGIMKRVSTLMDDAQRCSNAGSREGIKIVNDEFARLVKLLNMVDTSNRLGGIEGEWDRIRANEQAQKFGGNIHEFRHIYTRHVNDATVAYIKKHDGSLIVDPGTIRTGGDEADNNKKLMKFYNFSGQLDDVERRGAEIREQRRLEELEAARRHW